MLRPNYGSANPVCRPRGSRVTADPTPQQPVLLLTSDDIGLVGQNFGYTPLTRHVVGAMVISRPRPTRVSPASRVANGLISRVALSRWYRTSSAQLEWAAWRALRRGFRGVVHTLWGERDLGFLDLVPRRRHRLAVSFHTCDDDQAATLPKPHLLRGLDAVIVVSDSQRPFFERAGVPAERLHTIPLGIESGFFVPPESRPAGVPFVALAVGNYRRRYGLLREVATIMQADPGVRFEVVGPPSLTPTFSGLGNVTLRSGLTDAELLATYQSASCLVMPLENSTSNGALLEGMACGLPVVAERVGGVPEYLTPDAGFLTPPNQSGPMVAALRLLAAEPGMRRALGAAARARAETFAWPMMAAKLVAVYDLIGAEVRGLA